MIQVTQSYQFLEQRNEIRGALIYKWPGVRTCKLLESELTEQSGLEFKEASIWANGVKSLSNIKTKFCYFVDSVDSQEITIDETAQHLNLPMPWSVSRTIFTKSTVGQRSILV